MKPLSETAKDLLLQIWVLRHNHQRCKPMLGILADKLEEDGDKRHLIARKAMDRRSNYVQREEDGKDYLEAACFFLMGLQGWCPADPCGTKCPVCNGNGVVFIESVGPPGTIDRLAENMDKAVKEAEERALYQQLHAKYGQQTDEPKTKR